VDLQGAVEVLGLGLVLVLRDPGFEPYVEIVDLQGALEELGLGLVLYNDEYKTK